MRVSLTFHDGDCSILWHHLQVLTDVNSSLVNKSGSSPNTQKLFLSHRLSDITFGGLTLGFFDFHQGQTDHVEQEEFSK